MAYMIRHPLANTLSLVVMCFTFSPCSPHRHCEADQYVNGCSTPMGMDAPFKIQFTPACNKHDVCYGCGHHYNWSRDKCDEAFLRDALRTCRHTRGRRSLTSALLDIWYFFQGISKEERRCKLTAEFYYKLVRSFGKSHFELRDHQYCNNTCADKHGTPFENLEREFHQEKERLKISRPARSHGQS